MENSKIEWTEDTLTPITTIEGVPFCTRVSEGCKHCYAEVMARRIAGIKKGKFYPYKKHVAQKQPELMLHRDKLASLKLKKRPRKIFVSSMTDIFGEFVSDDWIFEILDAMYAAPQHIFQILTKREKNAYRTVNAWLKARNIKRLPRYMWMGMSVEDQANANKRIPFLLDIPAEVRWLSCEPLIGPVDLTTIWGDNGDSVMDCLSGIVQCLGQNEPARTGKIIHWVVVGGESGNCRTIRPIHPNWVINIRNACSKYETAFLFKQWGQWKPYQYPVPSLEPVRTEYLSKPKIYSRGTKFLTTAPDEIAGAGFEDYVFFGVGKGEAGRLLDGREWNGYPKV